MAKHTISNTLLIIGVLMLLAVVYAEVSGGASDPLVPAFAALLIGSTAVLDRIGVRELE